MRAIVNGKLYDTEKAEKIATFFIPYRIFDAYKTQKGNIFAVEKDKDIILNSEQIKQIINWRPGLMDVYEIVFGMSEEG